MNVVASDLTLSSGSPSSDAGWYYVCVCLQTPRYTRVHGAVSSYIYMLLYNFRLLLYLLPVDLSMFLAKRFLEQPMLLVRIIIVWVKYPNSVSKGNEWSANLLHHWLTLTHSIFKLIDLSLAVLGLRGWVWVSSSCGRQGLFLTAVWRLLAVVVTLVVENELQAARASVLAACRLSSCGYGLRSPTCEVFLDQGGNPRPL